MNEPNEPNDRGDQDEPEFALGDATAPDAAGAGPLAPWQRFPVQRRAPSSHRTQRAASLIAFAFLALLVVLLGAPGLGDGAVKLITRWLPTPTPTLGPGADLFYLVPNVPWGTVLLDGQPLAHLPVAGDGHPLRLTRGKHVFEWHAVPFMPLRCQVSVPNDDTDMCWLDGQPSRLFVERAPDGASIIPAHDDLNTLSVDQRAGLLMATQIALAQSASQTILQPGEPYAFLPGLASLDRTNIASQMLRATLNFHLLSDLGAREPCALGDPRIQPCRFPGQDCSAYCTLPLAPPPASEAAGSATWFASTFTWASWDYDTLSGHSVARNQGDPGVNFRLIDLGIAWDGANWRVTALFGHHANQPTLDDTVCSAARVWLARGPLAPLLPDGDATSTVTYLSSAQPALGCAVVVTPHGIGAPPTSSPSALFLARCGILLAANEAASALWPALAHADATESDIATQLAAPWTVS